MSFDGFNILESAVSLTEERDTKTLDNVLFDTLSRFIHFDVLILLRLPRYSDDLCLEMAKSMPLNAFEEKLTLKQYEFGEPGIERDELISNCIESGDVISFDLNGLRVLFPILIDGEVKGVLNIYGCSSDANTEKLIQGFVRIYSNHLAVLNDSAHDTLTGLLNRKTFDARLTELYSTGNLNDNSASSVPDERRNQEPVIHHQIGILDIDSFKRINDNFGHIYGDEVLVIFSNLMRKIFRSSDLLFRFGGEEFVVVLLNVSESQGFDIFERFRKELDNYNVPQVGKVTVSIGMANIDSTCHPTILLERIDQALYYAKEHGRNQVCNYHELVDKGLMYPIEVENEVDIF